MKVLIASHACSAVQNQKLFAIAASRHNLDITMVIPDRWLNEYGDRVETRLMDGFRADLVAIPVIKNGSVPLHTYVGRLSRLVQRVKPDVIYSHNEAYAASTAQWCRAASTLDRAAFGFFSCQNIQKSYPPPFRWMESWVYRSSQMFFPITQAVEMVHRAKGYANPSVVLPLGFDAERFQISKPVRQRHQEAGKRPFQLLYLGRIVEEKGLVTLTRALAQLQDLDWVLHMVGSGPFEARIRDEMVRANIDGRVRWPGFVDRDHVPALFASMDAMVIPSETRPNWKEQFGRVILESMACGTPVVGSDSGEIPTLIRRTGGGLVFCEGDATSCANSLREMMTDPESRLLMAERGYDNVHREYALASLADQFANGLFQAVDMVRSR